MFCFVLFCFFLNTVPNHLLDVNSVFRRPRMNGVKLCQFPLPPPPLEARLVPCPPDLLGCDFPWKRRSASLWRGPPPDCWCRCGSCTVGFVTLRFVVEDCSALPHTSNCFIHVHRSLLIATLPAGFSVLSMW